MLLGRSRFVEITLPGGHLLSNSPRYLSFTFIIAMLTACAGQNNPSDGRRESASISAADSSDDQEGGGVADNTGMLTFPGDNPTATAVYLNQVNQNIPSQQGTSLNFAQCINPSACKPDDSVKLRVVPVRGSHRVDWAVAMDSASKRGFIVARVMMVNPAQSYDKFKLTGQQRAYLWVGSDPTSTKRQIAVVTLGPDGSRTNVYPLEQQRFQYCEDNSKPGPVERKKTHNQPHLCKPYSVNKSGVSADTSGVPIWFPDGPLWINCKGGCCEVNQT